jgi:hypothetical protein
MLNKIVYAAALLASLVILPVTASKADVFTTYTISNADTGNGQIFGSFDLDTSNVSLLAAQNSTLNVVGGRSPGNYFTFDHATSVSDTPPVSSPDIVLVFDNASDTSSIFIDFNPTLSSPIPVILTGVISSGEDSRSAILTAAVPEPSTWALMILGFMGIGFMAYRRKNNRNTMALNAA